MKSFLILILFSIFLFLTANAIEQTLPQVQSLQTYINNERVTNTWDGSSSTAWNTNTNWSQNHYPTASEDVVIPASMPRYPIVTGTYSCNSVSIAINASLEIGNGTLSITGGLTSQGSLILNNELAVLNVEDMTFNSGSTLTINNNGPDINITDDVYFNAGSNINPTYGNFTFSGDSPSISTNASASIYNLISNSTNFRHAAGSSPLTIKGALTVNDSQAYICNVNVATSIYKTIWVGPNGVLQFNAGTLYLQGNNSNLTTRSGNYFNNLFINKSSGFAVTLLSSIYINGNLTINSGSSLIPQSWNITLGGNWENYAGDNGYIANMGEGAAVIFNGTGIQTINTDEFFDWMATNKSGGYLDIQVNADVECYYYDWMAGSLVVHGSFIENNTTDNGIFGTITVYGHMELHQLSLSTVNVYANLYILGGTFEIYGGLNPSVFSSGGWLTMNVGTLDFKNVGISILSSFGSTITGGTLRTVGNVSITDPDFNMTGGTLEMYGAPSSYIYTDETAQLGNVTINKSPAYTVTLYSNVDINGTLRIQSGYLLATMYTIKLSGDFARDMGATFYPDTGTVIFDGANDQHIYDMLNFNNFVLDKSANELYIYNETVTCNSYHCEAGTICFSSCNFTANDLASFGFWGNTVVNGAVVNFHQDSSQDVNFYGSLTMTSGSFNVYGGSGTSHLIGVINMLGGILDFKDVGVTIDNGTYCDFSGGTIRTVGNYTDNRTIFGASFTTLELYGSSSAIISIPNNAFIYELTIDKEGTASVITITEITVSENIYVGRGNFISGHNLSVYGDIAVDGNFQVINSNLIMGQNNGVSIYDGGSFLIVGTESTYASVTRVNSHTGYYSFTVNSGGYFGAHYALFEYMDADGIDILSGAIVNSSLSFSHCIFRNGAPGGTLLTINNNQDISMFDVTFPDNTWSGAFNVSKTTNQGTITFYMYMGVFGGEAYDFDTYDRIIWNQMTIPPVLNLVIRKVETIDEMFLEWDYPIFEAQYKVYHSIIGPDGPFNLYTTLTNKYINIPVPDTSVKRFYKVTAVLEP